MRVGVPARAGVPIAGALLLALAGAGRAQQAGTVTGQVKEAATDRAISSAQVVVVGTNLGTLTNADGRYSIRGVPARSITLRVLRLGYSEETASLVVSAGGTVTRDFALRETAVELAAIVTTVTGQQRRLEVGNAIAQVKAATIVETQAITNAAELLTARTPGVAVFDGTQTGAGVRVRIRGLSSLSLSNNPIYVLDGVRIEGTTGSSSVGVGGTTPARINDLNPEEIENIEVVKGPSASTLYGTDASNGVVVITTKRGVAGRPQWTYFTEQTGIQDRNNYPTAYWGWTAKSARNNTTQCYLTQAARGTCVQDSVTSYNLMNDPQSTPLGTGYRQQHGLQVRGGSEMVRYFLHGEWEDENGRLKIPEFDQQWMAARGVSLLPDQVSPNHLRRSTARANVDISLSKDADVSFSTGYIASDLRLPISDDSNVNGVAGNTYGGPGFKYNMSAAGDTLYGWRQFTPRSVYQQVTDQSIQRVVNSLRANVRPAAWLALRGTFGLDFIDRRDTQLCRFAECPDMAGNAPVNNRLGFKIDNRTNFLSYTLDAAATATRPLGKSVDSRTTLGVQYLRTVFDRNGAMGTTLPPGTTTVTAGAVTSADETTNETRTLGGFVEQQVAMRDRLFVTAALRSDRNSAFGADFHTVFYPKLSVSWIASEERFFPKMSWLNQLRLRGAYGASGVQPGTTDAAPYFSPTQVLGENGFAPGVVFSALGNTHLKPERSAEIEAGLDVTFWDNRVSTEITYYNKSSKDALVSRVLPPSLGTGLTSRFENLGEVQNRGWEGLINAQLVRGRFVGWDVVLNGSVNTNEIVSLGGLPTLVLSSTQQHRKGYPLYGWWVKPLKSWEDKNGNGIIEYNADPTKSEIVVGDTAEYFGSAVPRYSLTYVNGIDAFNRRLRLTGMLDYKGGYKMYNNTERIRCASRNNCRGLIDPTAPLWQQARVVAVREHPTRTVAGFIEDGAFLRLREMSLTYNLPEAWASRVLHARGIAATVAARNLGVLWTDYSGVDPEAYGTTGDAPSEFQSFAPPTYLAFRLTLNF